MSMPDALYIRPAIQVAAEDAEEVLPHFNAEIIKHYELKTRHDDWLTGVA
jgi:3-methyladenine DNA glycosylase AlkC